MTSTRLSKTFTTLLRMQSAMTLKTGAGPQNVHSIKTHGSTTIAKNSNRLFALLSGKITHRRKPHFSHLSESIIRALFNVKKAPQQATSDEINHMNTNNPDVYWQSAPNNHIDLEIFSQHYKESTSPDMDNNFDYEYMTKIASFIPSCDSENESCYNEYVHEIINAPCTADELSNVLHKENVIKRVISTGYLQTFINTTQTYCIIQFLHYLTKFSKR